MSLLCLCCKKYLPFIRPKILHNKNFVTCVQRQYSLLKQTNHSISQRNEHTNPFKSQYQLRKDVRFLSLVLTRCGLYIEANIARGLAAQIRCFSTSKHLRKEISDNENKNEEEAEKPENDEEKELRERARREIGVAITVFTLLFFYMILNPHFKSNDNTYRIWTWKEFYHEMLLKGEVERIDLLPNGIIIVHPYHGAVVNGERVKKFRLKLPNEFKVEEKIREAERQLGISPENGVSIYYEKTHESEEKLQRGFVMILLFFLWMLQRGKGGTSPTQSAGKSGTNPFNMFDNITKARFTRVDASTSVGKQKITFKDVAGLQEAKVEVMEFVDYLKSPSRYKDLGAKIPKGALLLGPPGCGKTLLAKAVSTEANVPFLAMAGSEFVEMVGGLGAARVRSLFEQARKEAPCIIYIDEIDAIGRQRGGGTEESEEEHTLNQLLVEMDGMGTVEGVILLASTNRADVLDKALLRSGRFDRHIMIDFPTLVERKEIFDMYLKRLKLSSTYPNLSEKLSQLTPRMTGADIANVCNEAALHAARVSKKSIDTEDFDYAVERVIAGVAKRTTALSPAEKKIIAYHESGHALVGWMLQHTDALLKISIIPRTSKTLGFIQSSPSNYLLFSKEMLFEQMCMALGGRVAESLIFNSVTSGAEDDLKKVTKIAYSQVKSFGMNEKIGYLSFPDDGTEFGTKPYSKKLSAVIDEEARSLIARAYKQTETILQENKEKLHAMAKTLLEREVLTYEDVEKLIGPPPHGPKEKVDINPLETLDTDSSTNTERSQSNSESSSSNVENYQSK